MSKSDKIFITSRRGTRMIAIPIAVFAGMVIAVVMLGILLWSVKRIEDPRFTVQSDRSILELLPSIASLTRGDVQPGNEVRILQNGEFFEALLPDLVAAKRSIHFETFLWHEGEIGALLARTFAEKAREGVEVRIILDASGTRPMPGEQYQMLKDSGCEVIKYHNLSIKNWGKLNNRDHRKIVVIDGVIGYTGGHDIAPEWTGNASNEHEYRDTSVRVRGPIVNRLQAAFSTNWIEQTGEVTVGDRYFPPLAPAGNVTTHVAYASPDGASSAVELLYYLAIISARKELIIQNPYFLPDPSAIDALKEAAARGVRISIMVPGTDATDAPLVQHASHHHFGDLLKSGIRIFEFQKTLLHQKVIIVDGVWSCIGSTNFDDRSFELNDEISMGILDSGIAAELKRAFEADLRYSKERRLEEWKDRPILHRIEDGLVYLVNEQL